MPSISSITYVYNDSSHIENAIRSVMRQSFKDIEIVIVDGGSTDGTKEIINTLAAEDGRIRVVCTHPGLGHQFNVGLKEATGEYIGICESDDELAPDMYEALYKKASESRADIVKGDSIRFFETDNGRVEFYCATGSLDLYNKELCREDNKSFLKLGVNAFWSAIYRRFFLLENKVLMNETPGAAYQDVSFAFLAGAMAQKIILEKKGVYYYRMDNPNSSVNMLAGIEKVDHEYKLLRDRLKDLNLWNEYRELFLDWVLGGHVWVYSMMDAVPDDAAVDEGYYYLKDIIDEGFIGLHLNLENKRLYECVYSSIDDYRKAITDKIEQHTRIKEKLESIESDSKVAIFGCGNLGKIILLWAKKRGIKEISLFDNSTKLQGYKIDGIGIKCPEKECLIREKYDRIIIANVDHAEEIKKQLLSYGIEENVMVICQDYDFFIKKILMRTGSW